MGDDRPPVYYEDNVLIIRASAIGTSCLWELVAAGQGYDQSPVPDTLQAAFDEGHRLEPIINEHLESMGYEITGHQDEGHLVIAPNLVIRYHPDGFINWKDGLRILEDKTMADSSWQRAVRGSVGDIFSEYNWQISVMMHAQQGMKAVWAAWNKGNSDGSPTPDKERIHFEPVDTPPISLTQIAEKAMLIRGLVEGEDIVVSGRPCDDPSHYPCRFLYLRPEAETVNMDGVVEIPDSEQEEVDRLVREYLMFKGQMDEAKTKMDAAKTALIERAGSGAKIQTDQWIVPVVNGKNVSPDWAAMPEEIREEAKKYKKETPYKYLKNIKRRGFEDGND